MEWPDPRQWSEWLPTKRPVDDALAEVDAQPDYGAPLKRLCTAQAFTPLESIVQEAPYSFFQSEWSTLGEGNTQPMTGWPEPAFDGVFEARGITSTSLHILGHNHALDMDVATSGLQQWQHPSILPTPWAPDVDIQFGWDLPSGVSVFQQVPPSQELTIANWFTPTAACALLDGDHQTGAQLLPAPSPSTATFQVEDWKTSGGEAMNARFDDAGCDIGYGMGGVESDFGNAVYIDSCPTSAVDENPKEGTTTGTTPINSPKDCVQGEEDSTPDLVFDTCFGLVSAPIGSA